MAEAATAWLLEVVGVVLDSLANTVLALNSVAGHMMPLCQNLSLCHLGYSFGLGQRAEHGLSAGPSTPALCCGLGICNAGQTHKINPINGQ